MTYRVLSISRDGAVLILGGSDGNISTWDIRTQTFGPSSQFQGHSDKITSTAISSDGRNLISGSWDETARVWDLQSGKNIQRFTGHDDALLCVAVSPVGDLVASAGWDDTIWIWNRITGSPVRALTGHKGSIISLAFSPDGRWLVSGSEDRTARLWEVEKGRHVLTFPGHSGDVSSVAFLNFNGEQTVVTGDFTGVIRLWDLSMVGQRDELVTLRGHQGAVTMVAFNPIAALLASSSVDKSIQIWDLKTNRPVSAQKNQPSNVSAVAFSLRSSNPVRATAGLKQSSTTRFNVASPNFIATNAV